MKHGTATFLVIANIPAIIGLMFFGWSLKEVILLYWLETIIIGVLAILKTMIARATPEISRWLCRYGAPALWAYKLVITVLMTVLVGVYALLTSLAVAFLLMVTDYGFWELPQEISLFGFLYGQMAAQDIWLALGVLCLSHVVSFFYHFLLNKEYQSNQDRQQAEILGRRVAAIGYAIVPSAILLVILVSLEDMISLDVMGLLRMGPAVLLVMGKTYCDIRAYRDEHGIAWNRPGCL